MAAVAAAKARSVRARVWPGPITPLANSYLSRQKCGKSEGSRQTSADKTTPKLVTEQLRASQKVLNKSDQFIPVVPVARGGAGAHGPTLRAPPMRGEGGAGSQ